MLQDTPWKGRRLCQNRPREANLGSSPSWQARECVSGPARRGDKLNVKKIESTRAHSLLDMTSRVRFVALSGVLAGLCAAHNLDESMSTFLITGDSRVQLANAQVEPPPVPHTFSHTEIPRTPIAGDRECIASSAQGQVRVRLRRRAAGSGGGPSKGQVFGSSR